MRCPSPELEVWLKEYNRTLNDLLAKGFKPTVENSRKGLTDLTRKLVTHAPAIARVEDDTIFASHGAIPVRIYHPAPHIPLPVLIYYHGGGHMAGSVEVYDPICRRLAITANQIIVSVDYRLAPEYPYPAGVEDAFAVTRHVWEALDSHQLNYKARLSIAGDSGGGALCATVAHLSQWDREVDIGSQVLIYPSLDYTMSLPSIDINGSGYLLEKEKIRWYFDHYFQHGEDRHKASPLFMEATERMPRTLVVIAEFCPLRDEGAAYVKKLREVGVHAEHLHFDDMIHAFLNMEIVTGPACDAVYQSIRRFIAP